MPKIITFQFFIYKLFLLMCFCLVQNQCLKDCRRFRRSLRQHQCDLKPESVEGPFYIDRNLIRSDISEYRPGIPFQLTLYFTNSDKCAPIPGLWITVWQCDAIGYYSSYTKLDPTVPYPWPTIPHAEPTDNSTFLRGAQQTDQDGMVQFNTVLPGWYGNRTRHIHFKIYDNDNAIFTGQLYFPEQFNDWIYWKFPYYVQKRVFNSNDSLFADFGGMQTTIYDIKLFNKKRIEDGFKGQIVIGLDLNQHSTDKSRISQRLKSINDFRPRSHKIN